MGFRTLALFQIFLALGWEHVRPNMLTLNMEEAAQKLRYPNISPTPPKIKWRNYYSSEDIENIRKIIFTFNYVNPKLLLIASSWAESLSNRPILAVSNPEGFIPPGILPGLPKIQLVGINQAPPLLRSLLLDIVKKHHAFDAASDFRALANFPAFLGTSWKYLRPYVGTKEI